MTALARLIAEEIAKWHALPWWPNDADDPEFHAQAKAIAAQIARTGSALDAAHCISRVFSSSFQACPEFSVEGCTKVGKALYERLVAESYV